MFREVRRRLGAIVAAAAAVALALGVSVPARALVDIPAAAHPAAATGTYTLLTLPDQGESQIYNFVNSATSSINMTMYELVDTTLTTDLVNREKAGVTVRVILDQAHQSYDAAAYTALTNGGVSVVWSSTAFTYTHQKTITVDGKTSYISTGNLDTTYYSTSRDFGVFDSDPNDVAAVTAVFNADFAHSSITPSDGDNLVWSPTDSQSRLLSIINGAQHTLDVEQEEFSDTALVNAIVADAQRGVVVRCVLENESNTYGSEISQVTAAGGKVTTYTSSTGFYIHAKTIVADYGTSTEKAFQGSENFSSNSLGSNRELGLIVSDPGVVTGLESAFNADFNNKSSTVVSVTNPGNQTSSTGSAASLQISASDTGSGQTLSYAATGLPAGLTINSSTGLISGTPSTAGTYAVTVTVTDTNGAAGATSFTWTVNGSTGNTVTVTNPGNQTGTVGAAASLQISATDSASGQTLTYSATGLPAGLSITPSTGLVSGTPSAAGSSSVTVSAKDTTGATGSASFTWTISSATGNTVTVTNPGNQTGTVGAAASLQISATDSASGQTLTYSATGLPAGLSIGSSTGLISGTPSAAGSSSVTVSAKDTTGATGSASFTWTISSGGGGCTAAQLLGNPGFENGSSSPSPWTVTSTHSPVDVISNSSKEPPHTGSWDAWLDGWGKTTTDTLSQPVTLPAGCTNYAFSFWLHIDTAETTTTTQYDKLTVQVLSSSGSVLATLHTYSNLDHNTGYAQRSFSLSAYAGQSITLKFTGSEDSELQTSFVIDDTALNVS